MSGTNRKLPWANGTHSWDKPEPVPGTNRPFSVEFHSKIAICPVCPWHGSRFVLGRLSHKGCQKNVCLFCVYWFFAPKYFGRMDLEEMPSRGQAHPLSPREAFGGTSPLQAALWAVDRDGGGGKPEAQSRQKCIIAIRTHSLPHTLHSKNITYIF